MASSGGNTGLDNLHAMECPAILKSDLNFLAYVHHRRIIMCLSAGITEALDKIKLRKHLSIMLYKRDSGTVQYGGCTDCTQRKIIENY